MAFKIKTVHQSSLPDEKQVMESMARLREGMETRAKLLWTSVGTVVAIIAVVGGVYFMQGQAEQQAQDQLQQGVQLYMNRPLTDVDASLSHVRQAVELFRSVLDESPKSKSAPLAMTLLANALVTLEDYEGATRVYKQFIDQYPEDAALNPLVYQRLAYVYLQQGDLQNAETTFEKILAIEKAPNQDLALLELAGLLEQQDQKQGALARYQELLKGYPHSVYLSEAAAKVGVLGGGEAPDPLAPDQGVRDLDSTNPFEDSASESAPASEPK